MREFKLPELGEDIESAEVIRVLVSEGDEINEEQSVLELETEKATIELPCPHGGRIARIHVEEGDTISIGDIVLSFEDAQDDAGKEAPQSDDGGNEERDRHREKKDEEKGGTRKRKRKGKNKSERHEAEESDHDEREDADRQAREEAASEQEESVRDEDDSTKKPAEERKPDREEETGTKPRSVRDERGPAGPGTRRLARELDVDLSEVAGTGADGRITREDVKAHARQAGQRDGAGLPDFEQWGPVERLELSSTMRAAARNVSTSWERIPHVTHHELADITVLEDLRKRYVEENEPAARITLTALVLKVVATALEDHRRFNSSFVDGTQEIIVKGYIHLGIAVDTERGLVVPVIRDCDRKSVVRLAAEVADLAGRARAGKLRPVEMKGGTFTVTNLGGIGGIAFTPIIRYPEVAILGLSRASWKRTDRGGEAERDGSSDLRLLLPLSLSYDHRVINGADAARFAARIAELLARPTCWLFEG